jgi:hypothetical protein
MNSFILGVASSLVAVAIVSLARHHVKHVINLAFFTVYPKIAGKWQIKHLSKGDSSRAKTRDIMELKQFGSRVTGINRTYDGERVVVEDSISGQITPTGLFRFTWESQSDEHHDYGSAFVRVSTKKQEMAGYFTTICSKCERRPANGEVLIRRIQ